MNYYGYEFITESFLKHHGILGQKWGVRRFQNEDGTRTAAGKKREKIPAETKRTAAKDAKEYARAKMYYGEGAGTRRKLIRETVNQRSKDPVYKAEFERQLAAQDMASHASKARKERARRDATQGAAKFGRGIVNAATGNIGRASAAAATAYTIAHVTGLDQKAVEWGKSAIKDVALWASNGGKVSVDDWLRMRGVF